MVGNQLKHICSRTGRPDKAGNCNVGWQKTYKAQDGKTNKAENSKNLHTYSLNLPISWLEEAGQRACPAMNQGSHDPNVNTQHYLNVILMSVSMGWGNTQ